MSQTKTQACWQSPSVYSHLLKMDMAGLAWEWLRRTQQYYLIYKSQTHLEQNRIIGDPIALRGVATDTAVLAGLHFL